MVDFRLSLGEVFGFVGGRVSTMGARGHFLKREFFLKGDFCEVGVRDDGSLTTGSFFM